MQLNVIKNRYIYFTVSGLFLIVSVFLLLFTKLNLGIDMTGGTQAEYSYTNTIDIEEIRTKLEQEAKTVVFEDKEVINAINAYTISGEKSLSVIAGFDSSIETAKLEELKNDFRTKALDILKQSDSTITETSYTNIGKSFGDYIKNTALLTLAIAIFAIAFYLAWAFSGVASGISVMSFSVITIITLFHDVLIASGLYVVSSIFFPEFKIDTFFVTALLTILGYSINDTIVVFDRIRANGKNMISKNKPLDEILDVSISDTLRRSIFTSLTLFFVLLTILFFGPETISGFVLVMLYGTVVGTYSSIFIASPLLYEFNKNKKISEIKKTEQSIEDKIVV
ncbi:MAG: protein translocase subunit SecF [Candidatus Gracilibacteria bacterium]|nr:protein translocase subunit SecF [Candidatus Gracilibacteria bacterium]